MGYRVQTKIAQCIAALEQASTPEALAEARANVISTIFEAIYAVKDSGTEEDSKHKAELQLLTEQLLALDTRMAANHEHILQRIHALSNHIMGTENKLDELAELLTLLASHLGSTN